MARKRHSIEGPQSGIGGKVLLAIVIAVIIFVVYLLLFSKPASPVSESRNLLAQTQLALKGLEKESFTFEGEVAINSESGGRVTIPFSGDSRIDAKNQRMYFKLNLESAQSGVSDVSFETYTIGKTVYMNFADTWAKVVSNDTLWSSELSQKLVDFAMKVDSRIASRETVNGKQTVKVVVTPTLEQIAELIEDVDPGFAESMGLTSFEGIGHGVKKIELVMWVDAAKFLPVRVQASIGAETKTLNPAGSGVVGTEIQISATANFDYETPFNIVLPAAAQSAEIIPVE